MTERRYVLTKLGPGDYVLPSNDGETLWRLHQYRELAHKNVRRWAVSRWTGSVRDGVEIAASVVEQDWSCWEYWAGCFRTRAEAIQSALDREQP